MSTSIPLALRNGLVITLAIALAAPAAAQTSDVRFGNLHAHTSYSDGLGEPEEAFRMACEVGLDFFAITEHNHEDGDGKGEANPVTGDSCKGNKRSKALIACLQPDRRVEVEIAGTKEVVQ